MLRALTHSTCSQGTGRTDTSVGVEMVREMLITHSVTDEDGSLTITRVEMFVDSKVYLDYFKAVAEAKVNQRDSASFAA
jgi:hypothetical protein